MNYAVYGYAGSMGSLLLVNSSLWVINGEWQLLSANGLFFVEATGQQINIKLLGHISYDGDYNSTLERFRNGEGQYTSVEIQSKSEPELCKRKYYGIDCSCSKCKG